MRSMRDRLRAVGSRVAWLTEITVRRVYAMAPGWRARNASRSPPQRMTHVFMALTPSGWRASSGVVGVPWTDHRV